MSSFLGSPTLERPEWVANQTPTRAERPPSKLLAAATEFEGILLAQWLDEVEGTFSTIPGENGEGKPHGGTAGSDNYRELGTQVLATSLAASGALGLARTIVQAMAAPNR